MLAAQNSVIRNNSKERLVNDGVYARHLSKVSTKRAVETSEDIYDVNGALLVKRGVSIQDQVVERIVKFKLLKPLDQSVIIENQLTAKDLQSSFVKLVKKNVDMKQMYSVVKNIDHWNVCCQRFNQQRILRQKLTVYRDCMPSNYIGTIFSAWSCMTIAQRMNFSEQEVYCAFLGGLVRNIGMLHIDPAITKIKGSYTLDQWRAIQSHVVIIKEIVDRCEDVPDGLGQAVLEHHERFDGSGYPFHKKGRKISLISQIIAVTDIVCSVYSKSIAPEGRGLRDILPVLQLNASRLPLNVYSTMILWLQECNLKDTGIINNQQIQQFVEIMLKKNKLLSEWVSLILQTAYTMPGGGKNKQVSIIINCAERFVQTLRGAGIMDKGYIRWLDQVVSDKLSFAYREVEDYALMLDEMRWQLNHLTHQFESLCNSKLISSEQQQHVLIGLGEIRYVEEKLERALSV